MVRQEAGVAPQLDSQLTHSTHQELLFSGWPATHEQLTDILTKLISVAGGLTIETVGASRTLRIAVVDDSTRAHVVKTIAQFNAQTRSSILQEYPKDFVVIAVPRFRNPGSGGERSELFSRESREGIMMALSANCRYVQTTQATGRWINPDEPEAIIEDENDLWYFESKGTELRKFLELIRGKVLEHPDCDQQSLYVSANGRAVFLDRETVAADKLNKERGEFSAEV